MKNKKLFAILTLVCFMMTLMPVAAFAASGDPLSATASVFATVDNNVEVYKQEPTSVQISLKDAAGDACTTSSQTVYVWAETVVNQPNDAFVADEQTADEKTTSSVDRSAIQNKGKGVYAITTPANQSVTEFAVKFLRAGEYTLKASFDNPLTATDIKDVVLFGGAAASYKKVTVSSKAPDTEYWGVNVKADKTVTAVDTAFVKDSEETGKLATNPMTVKVEANGVKSAEVTLTVHSGTATNATNATMPVVTNYPVTLDTNSSNIELSDKELTTNHNGQVKFKVAGLREGTYKVYVTVGDLEVAVTVQVGASIANDIEVIKAPEGPVAKDEKMADYKDVIQFQITDVNGNIVTGCSDKCIGVPDSDKAPYVTILEQPATSKIKDKDIYLTAVDDYYTLALTSGSFNVEGTYSVKAILDNGRSATVTWEVKKFATPVELVLTYKQEAVELNGIAVVDELVYVDANGVKKLAKDANLAASGYAISLFDNEGTGNNDSKISIGKDENDRDLYKMGTVKVKDDEKYIGSTINVTAVSERYNLVANATIKVTSDAAELKFANKTGEVNVNNKIGVQVVDADGNKVAPTNVEKAEIYYVILDKPADAKVSATTSDSKDLKTKGAFTMALTSNKVGNVAVQAVVKLTTNSGNGSVVKYYTGTQIFAIGNGSVGDVVVMSIGSHEVIVNDAKATIDAAPMIQNDRTFVPFRALAEAFGAEVAYDEATQAVTAKLNGVEVVMTIGSATYTVNGAEKTMDVAPFINGSRTMVPVRFAAEAFGIKVIPTYNPDGTTADILFNL